MKIGSIFLRGKTKAEGQVLFSQSMIGRVLLSFTENTAQTLKGICLFTGGHILFESSHTYFLKKYFFQYLSYQRSLVILYQYNIQVSIQVSNFVILFFSYVNNEKNMSLPMLALHQFSTWLFSYPFFSFLSLSILHISRSVQNLPYLKARLYFLQIFCQYGSSRFKHLRKKKKTKTGLLGFSSLQWLRVWGRLQETTKTKWQRRPRGGQSGKIRPVSASGPSTCIQCQSGRTVHQMQFLIK